MPYSKIALFLGVLVLIVAAILSVAYVAQKSTSGTVSVPQDTSTTTIHGPGYTLNIDESPSLVVPSLDRGVRIASSIPQDAATLIKKHVADAVALLKADHNNAGAWLDLALWYHTANDFDGAREVWEFVAQAAPSDTTALDNLGRLYHFDLHDYPKAESYFKKSIVVAPTKVTPYVELFQLYTLSYKQNTSAAVDIMRKAEAFVPTDPGLPFSLGAYYRDHNDDANARTEFLKAIALARTAGNLSLVQQINDELQKLEPQ